MDGGRPSRPGSVAERSPYPARHEVPELDNLALDAARAADRLFVAARDAGLERWVRHFAALPDRLRDEPIAGLRSVARSGRAAYGSRDSVRDALPAALTEPFLEATDRLLKALARWEAHRP